MNIHYLIFRIFDIKAHYRTIKWFIQRGYRGYADCDVWNTDFYIAKIFSKMLKSLSENLSGYPSFIVDDITINAHKMTSDEREAQYSKKWQSILIKYSNLFKELNDLDNMDHQLYQDIFNHPEFMLDFNKPLSESYRTFTDIIYKKITARRAEIISELKSIFDYWGDFWD